MNTETLIHELAMQLQPVRPLSRPVTRLAQWVLITAVFIFLSLSISGVRPDIVAAFAEPAFTLRTLLMLGVGLAAAFSAFSFAVPGNSEKWPVVASVVGIAAFFATLGFWLISAKTFSPGPGMICVRNVFSLGIITGTILCIMLRRAAPIRAGVAGLFALLGAASLANFATQFICQREGPVHVLVWHLIPVVLLCGGGILAGRLLFRWNEGK